MTKRLALFAAGLFLICATYDTSAQDSVGQYTGVELLDQCQALTTATEYLNAKAMRCVDYLRGITDAYHVWQNNNDVLRGNVYPPACFPEDGVSPLELAKVVVKFLNDHPNRLTLGLPGVGSDGTT